MKICIFSRSNTIEDEAIKRESEKRGHECSIINPKSLIFNFSGDLKITTNDGIDLTYFDVFVPRVFSITETIEGKKYKRNSKNLIIKYLLDHDKIFLDKNYDHKRETQGKIYQLSRFNNFHIPIFPTVFLYRTDKKYIESSLLQAKINPPYIIKDVAGSKGENIFKCDSVDEIKDKIEQYNNVYFMIQAFHKIDHDLRILVLGNRVLGAIEKIHKSGDFKGNISQGADSKIFKLSNELETLALMTNNILQYDFTGVDIAIVGNKNYILEVNEVPQFRGFVETTGLNVALEIVKYLEYLYNTSL